MSSPLLKRNGMLLPKRERPQTDSDRSSRGGCGEQSTDALWKEVESFIVETNNNKNIQCTENDTRPPQPPQSTAGCNVGKESSPNSPRSTTIFQGGDVTSSSSASSWKFRRQDRNMTSQVNTSSMSSLFYNIPLSPPRLKPPGPGSPTTPYGNSSPKVHRLRTTQPEFYGLASPRSTEWQPTWVHQQGGRSPHLKAAGRSRTHDDQPHPLDFSESEQQQQEEEKREEHPHSSRGDDSRDLVATMLTERDEPIARLGILTEAETAVAMLSHEEQRAVQDHRQGSVAEEAGVQLATTVGVVETVGSTTIVVSVHDDSEGSEASAADRPILTDQAEKKEWGKKESKVGRDGERAVHVDEVPILNKETGGDGGDAAPRHELLENSVVHEAQNNSINANDCDVLPEESAPSFNTSSDERNKQDGIPQEVERGFAAHDGKLGADEREKPSAAAAAGLSAAEASNLPEVPPPPPPPPSSLSFDEKKELDDGFKANPKAMKLMSRLQFKTREGNRKESDVVVAANTASVEAVSAKSSDRKEPVGVDATPTTLSTNPLELGVTGGCEPQNSTKLCCAKVAAVENGIGGGVLEKEESLAERPPALDEDDEVGRLRALVEKLSTQLVAKDAENQALREQHCTGVKGEEEAPPTTLSLPVRTEEEERSHEPFLPQVLPPAVVEENVVCAAAPVTATEDSVPVEVEEVGETVAAPVIVSPRKALPGAAAAAEDFASGITIAELKAQLAHSKNQFSMASEMLRDFSEECEASQRHISNLKKTVKSLRAAARSTDVS